MEFDGGDCQITAPPNLVTLSPFTPMKAPQSRRLSSHLFKPRSPIPVQSVSRRPSLAWISLQGRLIGAEEASSAKTVGVSALSAGEVVAWELFSPLHRILLVAVVAVATANSDKNREIYRLRKCVQLREQILASMQEKLDCLCEQVNVKKDQAEPADTYATRECWLCDQHRVQLGDLKDNATSEAPETIKRKVSFPSDVEPEERRMSDLSDWASTVASSIDVHLENLAIDQDVYNLKRECEEKDHTIQELSGYLISKDAASLKRVEELEDIIRQKAMIITKLRKDMAVLEQKVVQLTRLRRRSCSGQAEQSLEVVTPAMRDNVLYDMDSSTSPSSSDSDYSSSKKKWSAKIKGKEANDAHQDSNLPTPGRVQHSSAAQVSSELLSTPHNARLGHVRPLPEKSINKRSIGSSSSYKRTSSTSGDSKSRRRVQTGGKVGTPSLSRWV